MVTFPIKAIWNMENFEKFRIRLCRFIFILWILTKTLPLNRFHWKLIYVLSDNRLSSYVSMKLFRCGLPDDMCVFSQLNLSIVQASLLVTCPNLVDTQDPMSKDITKRVKRTLLIRMGFISFKKCDQQNLFSVHWLLKLLPYDNL